MSELSHSGGRSGEFRRVALWDGESDRGVCDVEWTDGVISAVRPSRDGGDDPRQVLGLIPGLIDTHVHLGGFAGGRDAVRGFDGYTWPLVTDPREQVLHAAANAQAALVAGATTLRDLAADESQAGLSRVFDAGILFGPRLLASGPVGMTAGHLDLFTPRAVRDRPPTADGPDACRALVRRWARAGLTGIKVFTSGGVLSMGDAVSWRNHTRAELAATVDEAHALGMRVACHTHSAAGIDLALELSVDSIEHGTGLTAAQATELAARGLPVAPTLVINDRIAAGAVGGNDEARGIAVALLEHRDQALADAAAAGVDFVLGTDTNGYLLEFGELWAELARMVAVLGISAERALAAGTSRAAAALGLADVTGTIRPGLAADLVLARGRPWRDPGDLDRTAVDQVIARGRVVPPGLVAR